MSKSNGSGKPRVQLSPAEKYELWVEVLTGECTQRQAADRWGVDRSTVISICRTAKQAALDGLSTAGPGRPGKTPEQAALEDARAETERLRAALAEQAVALHLQQGKPRWG